MTPIQALSFPATLGPLLTRLRRRLAVLVPALLLLLAPASVRAQTFALEYAQMQVTTGLTDPGGITVDGAGATFIAEGHANRVRKFAPVPGQSSLAASVVYDATAAIPANNPVSVSADGHGNLFVCNYGGGQVVKLVAASNYAPTLVASGLGHPADAVADDTGRVFIAELDTGRVRVALPNAGGGYNAVLQDAITAGGPAGALTSALAVALDGAGELYVLDSYMDGFGNPASRVLKIPIGTGFSGPATAILDPLPPSTGLSVSGLILYIAVHGTGEIRTTDLDGNPLSILATDLADPIGVKATADGVYYTANGDGKAWRILPDRTDAQFGLVGLGTGSQSLSLVYACLTPGTLSAGGAQVLTQGQPGLEFTALGSGTLSAGDTFTAGQRVTVDINFQPTLPGLRRGLVSVVDGAGTNLAASVRLAGTGSGPQLVFPGQPPKPLDAGAVQAFGVVADAAGNLFYADQGHGQVVKASPHAGGYTTTVVASGLTRPRGVAVDSAGNVWFSDGGTAGAGDGSVHIAEKTLGAYQVFATPVATGLESPGQVALDAQGDPYVVDVGGNQILHYTGFGVSQAVMTQADGLTRPTGVAVGENGEVLITDRTATGGTLWLAIPLSAGGYHFTALSTDFQNPRGVAFDSTGIAYVADGNRVVKSMSFTGSTATFGPVATGLAAPEAVAVDSFGNVIISDPGAASPLLRVDLQDPPALDFGTVTVGGYATRTVTLLNRGDRDLEFPPQAADSNPAIPAPFTWDGSNTFVRVPAGAVTPTSLAAGAAIDLVFGYRPSAVGADGGNVVLTTDHLNVANTEHAIAVTGQGLAAPTAPPPTQASTTALDVTGGTRFGQTVTLTATVTAPAGSTQAPTGTVTFQEGGTILGTGPVDLEAGTGGTATATLRLSSLAVQDHTFTAVYSGDGTYQGSTSDPKTWTIQAAGVQFAPASAPGQPLAVTLRGTLTAALDVQVSAQGTLAPGTLTLSVVGLPANLAVAFSPSARVDTASLPATVQVRLTAGGRALARTQPGWVPPLGGGAAGAFLACGLLALPWARRRRTGPWTGLALLLTLGLLGCWSRSGGSPTTYQASLVAKDSAGTTVGTAPLSITVVP